MIKEYKGEIGNFNYEERLWEVYHSPDTGHDELHWRGGDFVCRLPSGVTSCNGMFRYCNLSKGFEFHEFDTFRVKSMVDMFADCTLPEGCTAHLSGFDTQNVTDMSGMFRGCDMPADFNLGQSFLTHNVRDMSRMFEGCVLPRGFALKGFNTVNVINMSRMFFYTRLPENFSLGEKFYTKDVKLFTSMFEGCHMNHSFSLGKGFTFKNAYETNRMFYYAYMPSGLMLPKDFDRESILNTEEMFNGCMKYDPMTHRYNPAKLEEFLPPTEDVYSYDRIMHIPVDALISCKTEDELLELVRKYCKA